MKSSIAATLLGCIASVAVGAPAVGERGMSLMNDVGDSEHMNERAPQLVADLGENGSEGSDSNFQGGATQVSVDDSSSHVNSLAEESADTIESEAGSVLTPRAEAAKEPGRGYPANGSVPEKQKSGIVRY